MRTVPNREKVPAPELLPRSLDDVRDLAGRFPHAGLRPLTIVPFADRVWLALESMQVTGSFKVRGALVAIDRLRRAGKRLVVVASAGNHGAGVAHAAKELGVEAIVVVPRGAPRTKVEKIQAAGARVIVSENPGYDATEVEAMALAEEKGAPFLSPYDDLDVLAGNGGSLGLEIVRGLGREPAEVHCPIGGGGLATGLACAVEGRVVAVQSEASCAFAQSLERGRAVTELPHAVTLADGLEGGISERAFARCRAVLDCVVVATEEEIRNAMGFARRELGIVVEGSAACALVPILHGWKAEGDIVVVLTGRNVDVEM